MEPITIGTVVKGLLVLLTLVSATKDMAASSVLEDQAARYNAIANAYIRVLDDQYANNEINERQYTIELERARQIRRAYIDQADIVSSMAQDKRLGAVTSVTIDAILNTNPITRVGGVAAPGSAAYIGDAVASAMSTRDAATNLFMQLNPGAPVDEALRDRIATILGRSENDLVNAILGARLNWIRTKWRQLNAQYPNNPNDLYRAFDAELGDIADKVVDHSPQLVGPGRRFNTIDDLKDYLREHVENMESPTALVPADAFEDMDDTGDEPPEDAVPDDAFEETSDPEDMPPPDDAFEDEQAFGPLPMAPDLTYLMNDAFYADYTCQTNDGGGSIRIAWNGSNFTYGELGSSDTMEIPAEELRRLDMQVDHDTFVFRSLIYNMGAPGLWLPLDGSVYSIPEENTQDSDGHYVGYVNTITELRLQPSPDTQTILSRQLATTLYQGGYTDEFVNDDREGNVITTGYQRIVDDFTFRAWYDNATGLLVKTHLQRENIACHEEGDYAGRDCPKDTPMLSLQCTLTDTNLPLTE